MRDYLEDILQDALQTTQRRTHNFSVCDVCLNILRSDPLWIDAGKVNTFAGEIVLAPVAEGQLV